MDDPKLEMLMELSGAGFDYRNLDEIFQNQALLPKEVDIILKWLPFIYAEQRGAADLLVRALISAKEAFDPSLLIEMFEKSDLNSYLKFGIGNTLALARTADISTWIKDQLLNGESSMERYALVAGLPIKGGFGNDRQLMDFLRIIFDRYHDETMLKLFKKYGDKTDAGFLHEKLKELSSKEVKQASKVIESMLKKNLKNNK